MWLQFLIPLTLFWPIAALAVEGTALNRYRGTPLSELLALLAAFAAYVGLFLALSTAIGGGAGIVAATLISSILIPIYLFLGFKVFGVRGGGGAHAHR